MSLKVLTRQILCFFLTTLLAIPSMANPQPDWANFKIEVQELIQVLPMETTMAEVGVQVSYIAEKHNIPQLSAEEAMKTLKDEEIISGEGERVYTQLSKKFKDGTVSNESTIAQAFIHAAAGQQTAILGVFAVLGVAEMLFIMAMISSAERSAKNPVTDNW